MSGARQSNCFEEAYRQGKHDEKYRRGTTEGGACLTGHHGRYAKVTCSYRWQAHVQAIELSEAEKDSTYHAYRTRTSSARVRTMAFPGRHGVVHPKWYVATLRAPQGGDWDLTGPPTAITRKLNQTNADGNGIFKTVPVGGNFTQASWPYWHNAHHLIPKRVFMESIDETSKASSLCPDYIKASLMVVDAVYNINHKRNMILLPQDEEVGRIVKLPRHLVLRERYREEMRSHTAYSDFVKKRLGKIWIPYKSALDNRKHAELSEITSAKEALHSLSDELREKIVSFGASQGGHPLVDMDLE